MHFTHAALWMLIVLALAIAGLLTVLDEILSDTPYKEPAPTDLVGFGEVTFGEPVSYGEPMPYGEPRSYNEFGSKNPKRRSGGECRT